ATPLRTSSLSRSGRGARLVLLRPGTCRLAHPAPFLVGLAAALHALPVAGPEPRQHVPELLPVDRAVTPVARLLVPGELVVRNAQAQEMRLRHGHVDELLPQLVVREPLDLPGHGLRRMLRVLVAR